MQVKYTLLDQWGRHNSFIFMIKIKHMSAQTEMKVISVLLDEAMEHGLEVEIIYQSLKLMREDDALTPSQAMQEAMNEWIK